jgi:ferredoxin
VILKFQPSSVRGKLPSGDAIPTLFERVGLETPVVIHLSNYTKTIGSCLRCPVPPCTFYRADEMVNDYFKEFPADTSTKVCPTDAIQIDAETGIPTILSDKCISCGLCVARCPVQAIVISRGGAKVNDSENEFFRLTGKPVDTAVVEAVLRQYQNTPIRGHIADAEFAAYVYERIVLIGMQSHTQFPNLLARNLMFCNGIPFLVRRLGDTNMRIDGVFNPGGNRLGVAEIEYSDGVILDAPRDLLDDCAVLQARYRVPLKKIVPLVVSLRLPNKRSEY